MPLTQDQVIDALVATANKTYNGVTPRMVKDEIAKLQKGEQVNIIGMIVRDGLASIDWTADQFDAHTLEENNGGLLPHA